ncbi:hypothetical protein HYN49_02765 [Flavobacterium pallidum]|uniref:Uncharacterized protein n=1 Tax=Flavobacterium pallidum TaxID=2172098 RepID=A0A2S1SLB4_9FLAO|nr:hypothetical protein HYN49_02765 [Flavobacterium pallidum]
MCIIIAVLSCGFCLAGPPAEGPPPPIPPGPPGNPIDSGILYLLVAGLGYGVFMINRYKTKKVA